MARLARGTLQPGFYHVLNRGNQRQTIFRHQSQFALFLDLLAQSLSKVPVRLWGYCLMGNHWHLVVSVDQPEDLSQWMHWLTNRHVRLMHRARPDLGGGHVYQGRFKAFPIQDLPHLHTELRYVEANPLRARLVRQAEHWTWSSLTTSPVRVDGVEVARPRLQDWPRNAAWRRTVNAPQQEVELDLLRRSIVRGTPFGSAQWTAQAALKAGLESTLRPRGRPRKSPPEKR
ncbi:MAG TPA: transposase [Acidobacteriaceae bacterium]